MEVTASHLWSRVRRLSEDGTLVPKHVGLKLIMNCVLWFAIHCIVLCAFVIQYTVYTKMQGKSRNSSGGMAIRYGLDGPGIESRWREYFPHPFQTGPGAHPTSYTMGTESFPGVKRPGRGAEPPPPSSAEVEGSVELYVCSPSGSSWPVLGRTLPLLMSNFLNILTQKHNNSSSWVYMATLSFFLSKDERRQFSETRLLCSFLKTLQRTKSKTECF